jgi:hypothetical protein
MNEQNKLNYSLNMDEIYYLNPDSIVLSYDEFNKIENILELLKKKNKIIILYLLESLYSGHYTCLFVNKYGIQYFDSYGQPVDFFLDILTKKQRIQYNEKDNKLQKLLKPYNVNYNEYLLQGKGTQTCGQFVTHRLHHYKLSEKQYINKFFKNNKKSPDEIVANYVLKLLKI